MRTAFLRGREHLLTGAVAAVSEGTAAVSLSRGGASKRYAHVDPNEDAAAFARGPLGVLLAVADGHGGCEAAEAAIEDLLARRAPRWTGSAEALAAGWEVEALSALFDAHQAILGRTTRAGGETSRTTVCLALARFPEDFLGFAAIGDSHLFHVSTEVVDLNPARGRAVYLGWAPETPETLAQKCVVGSEGLSGTRALVLATDGLSEPGIGVDDPEGAVADAVARAGEAARDLRPLALARGLVEEALAAQRRRGSGDNVGCAVLWL
jgi:serine/threonine protein phosphatase PrpC